MRKPLEPYLVNVPQNEVGHGKTGKRVACCPVCGNLDTLRVARGMILCTNCFWALGLKQAS